MEKFDIFLDGTWSFSYSIKANSKEEAIEKAIKEMDMEACPIDLQHNNQWFEDDEEEEHKKGIPIGQ